VRQALSLEDSDRRCSAAITRPGEQLIRGHVFTTISASAPHAAAGFDGVGFEGDALFDWATFHGDAEFFGASFQRDATAYFHRDANFGGRPFAGVARFDRVSRTIRR
jgi:hypothetical protein